MILELAKKHNRMVFVVGRSMLNVIAHARDLGYIDCEDSRFQPLRNLRQYADKDVLILTTGSQGEPMAALTRIANDSHRQIKVKAGDTVVFSANPIPGNTIAVVNTIDKLMMQGAQVIYGRHHGIHVSGHGSQEDQKLMLGLTRPKFFLPVHGEHRMLVRHSQTAQSMGVPAENMVIIKNGDIVTLTPDRIAIDGKVQSGVELVDSSRQGIVDQATLKDRQQLAEDGIVTIGVTFDNNGALVTEPAVNLRGIAQAVDAARLQQQVANLIGITISERRKAGDLDLEALQPKLETEVRRLIRREIPKRYPMVVLLVQHAAITRKAKVVASPVPALGAV